MNQVRLRWSATFVGLLVSAATGLASVQIPPPPNGGVTPPRNYPLVDNVRGTLVTTNAAPVRPLVVDGATKTVWAVNTNRSTVERFELAAGADPTLSVSVPWGPVSIARWEHPVDGFELLVVCRNTWGLLRLDEATLEPKAWVPLRAEPSDIVVDAGGRAFVSCTGADAVAQIDLANGGAPTYYVEATHSGFRMKSPYFLSLDGDGVVVAPLHSGNNTTFQEPAFIGGAPQEAVDLVIRLDPANSTQLLPDEDLFRINPGAGTVTVEETGLGTLLFAHGRHPADGTYWLLNTEAKNDKAQSEPGLQFDFVDNRATLLVQSQPPAFVRFDDGEGNFVRDQAGLPASGNVVGQPFALAFHPTLERTFVAGLLTDNVVMLDGDGGLLLEIDLPAGAIPRGLVLLGEGGQQLFVHCWGTGTIELYEIDYGTATAFPIRTFAFHDPTPPALRHGRELFYDGHNSAQSNVSCASCHVDAGTDFLLWNLSGLPYDNKGPMVTQTLVGIERVGPFHWRGERTLADFNTLGVPGLLGGTAMGPADFADFQSWVFSLVNPANPRQARIRKILATKPVTSVIPDQILDEPDNPFADDALNGVIPLAVNGGNGVAGLHEFRDVTTFQGRFACGDCHAFPLGTNNDIFADGENDLSDRGHFKNTPFQELWRKEQSMVVIDGDADPGNERLAVRSFLGIGLAHNAIFPGDVVRFTQGAVPDEEQLLDIAAFIAQWDQGLGKAAHFAFLLSPTSPPEAITSELQNYLLRQAERGNCDVAVFGRSNGVRAGWRLDLELAVGSLGPDDDVFVVDSELFPDTRSLDDFVADGEPALFVGLPVGMAERLAVDEDMDLVPDRDDAAPLSFGPGPDDELDPLITRAEVEWTTTNTARVVIETDEPTTLSGSYTATGSPTPVPIASGLHSRVHNLLLTQLRPSTPGVGDNPLITGGDPPPEIVTFSVDYTVTDVWGNETLATLSPPGAVMQFFTLPEIVGGGVAFETLREAHVVPAPPVVTLVPDGGTGWTGTVSLQAILAQGPPPQAAALDRVFVVRLFRRPGGTGDPELLDAALSAGTGTLRASAVGTFFPGEPLRILRETGPFLVNDAGSVANPVLLEFALDSTLQPGDTVVANIETVVEVTSAPEVFGGSVLLRSSPSGLSQWNFPRSTESALNNEPGTIAQ